MSASNFQTQDVSRRRILMLTTDSAICGTERIILSLLTHLDRTKYDASLVTLWGPGDLCDAARELGYPALNLRMGERSKWAAWKEWRRFLNEFRPDVIQSLLIHSNLLGRLTVLFRHNIKLLSGISTVYTYEGYGRLYAWLEWLTHPLDSLYVINSELGMQNVLDLISLPDRRLALVHNGIEITEHPPVDGPLRKQARDEFGWTDDHLVVGIVAQFRPAKKHDFLIQALTRLQDRFPSIRLLMIGEGEREKELKRLAQELGVNEKVIFAGYRSDARRLLAGMDVFALPSLVEGEPVSLMEAMDAGLPVVAAAAGGIPEIVSNNTGGILIEPNNLDALCDALARILSDSQQRKQMGAAGRERIHQLFSAQRMTEEFQNCYERCLGKRKS